LIDTNFDPPQFPLDSTFKALLKTPAKQFGGEKSLCPLEKTLKIADYMFCPHKIITSRTIRISGTLLVKTQTKFKKKLVS
jgi:hypothetical protein